MSNNNWRQMRRLMWVQIVLLALILLTGCSPYAGMLVGYSEDGGDYYTLSQREIREDGCSAIAYIGADRQVSSHTRLLCQATHFSTCHNKPEVVVNHIGCGVEVR